MEKFLPTFITLVLVAMLSTSCHHRMEISVDAPDAADTTAAGEQKVPRPMLEVFVENSGSMDGYMADGSQLKDAVFQYVSDLERISRTTRLYYINSNIISGGNDLNEYIRTLSPATFRAAGGDRSNSDLRQMLSQLADRMNDSTVVVFVSDCILDLPATDAAKWLENSRIRIRNSMLDSRDRVSDFAVEIFKMESDFSGSYYYPDGRSTTLSGVKRPYYIWVMGSRRLIAGCNRHVPPTSLRRLGLKETVAFAPTVSVVAKASNHNMTGGTINASREAYHATVLADLGPTLMPDTMLTDSKNYRLSCRRATIDGVYPVTGSEEGYTHYISLTLPESERVTTATLSLTRPAVPAWVEASEDLTGRDVEGAAGKTTGISRLIGGVADAFASDSTATQVKLNFKYE